MQSTKMHWKKKCNNLEYKKRNDLKAVNHIKHYRLLGPRIETTCFVFDSNAAVALFSGL